MPLLKILLVVIAVLFALVVLVGLAAGPTPLHLLAVALILAAVAVCV